MVSSTIKKKESLSSQESAFIPTRQMYLLAEERPNGGTQFLCEEYKDFAVQESLSYSSSLLPATALPQLSSFPLLSVKKKCKQSEK